MTDGTGPSCVLHPAVPATLSCERCGDFVCDSCLKEIVGRKVCASCTKVEGVDYLQDYKRKLWGKRDGFVWLFGGLGTITVGFYLVTLGVSLAAALASGLPPGDFGLVLIPLAFLTVTFVINLSYLLLQRWARVAIIALPLVSAGLTLTVFAMMGSGPETMGPLLVGNILPFLFTLSAFLSPRNKLAFKIEVPDEKLEKLYKTYVDNQMARYSLFCGALGLILPPLILLALPLGIIGLARVDPEAWPPVGGRAQAIAGLVLSGLVFFGYGGLFLYLNL